jgi:hypothetical protein
MNCTPTHGRASSGSFATLRRRGHNIGSLRRRRERVPAARPKRKPRRSGASEVPMTFPAWVLRVGLQSPFVAEVFGRPGIGALLPGSSLLPSSPQPDLQRLFHRHLKQNSPSRTSRGRHLGHSRRAARRSILMRFSSNFSSAMPSSMRESVSLSV